MLSWSTETSSFNSSFRHWAAPPPSLVICAFRLRAATADTSARQLGRPPCRSRGRARRALSQRYKRAGLPATKEDLTKEDIREAMKQQLVRKPDELLSIESLLRRTRCNGFPYDCIRETLTLMALKKPLQLGSDSDAPLGNGGQQQFHCRAAARDKRYLRLLSCGQSTRPSYKRQQTGRSIYLAIRSKFLTEGKRRPRSHWLTTETETPRS